VLDAAALARCDALACDVLIALEPDGLAAWRYRVPPHLSISGPAPRASRGQMWLVVGGALARPDAPELHAPSCLFVFPSDPALAATHALLGNLYIAYDWDWPAAGREIGLALTAAPNDAYVLFIAAVQSQVMGRLDDALRLIGASLAEDPLNPSSYLVLHLIQIRRGRLAEAEAAIRRTLEISPTFSKAHYFLGVAQLLRGQTEMALAEITKETDEGSHLSGLAIAYFALGRKSDSDAALAQVLRSQSSRPFEIAGVYAFRGESDDALKWLERAYAQKDPYLCSVKGEATLRKLESDPRFKAFLKKMNLPSD